jgi:hypothetical protein
MRVTFLAPRLSAAGAHPRHLAAREHDVRIALTDERPAQEGRDGRAAVVAVEDVLGRDCDVAVATTWDAAVRLLEVPATRHALWVDGFGHHRLGSWQAERVAAALVYDLPVDFLCAGAWVEEALAEHRPEARRLLAREGLDHEAALPREAPDGDGLRVLVDRRWEPDPGADGGPGAALGEPLRAEDRWQQYARADVLLMLNPVDGVLGSPLEAMRAGCVPVVLPAGGQAELVEHGVTGIVAEPEDPRGLDAWLRRLDADRPLLERLRAAAVERATAWPGWTQATEELEAALARLVAEEPPAEAAWPVRLMADAMAGVAVLRNDHFILAGELRRLEGDQAYQAAQRARELWQRPRLRPLRAVSQPVLRAARKRLAP